MSEIAITLKNVSKCYKRYARPVDRLKEILLPGKSRADEFWALRDINLEIHKGQTVGIVGRNGSGKSTLLQIIAGTLTPTTGEVNVCGRVSALLELGSGFNPEFTGRQNVFFNGRLLGLSQKEIEDKFDEIAGFADIGDFIDEPVKTYSSGMFVRLAFAVAINVNPEILIVDEALAVGDGVFIHRCMASIKAFQDSGGTILFVSHEMGTVSRLCSQAIWINDGNIVEIGEPDDISRHYQAWMYEQINDYQKKHNEVGNRLVEPIETRDPLENLENIKDRTSQKLKVNPFNEKAYREYHNIERFGTGRAEIISFEVLDNSNKKVGFVYPKDRIKLVVKVLTYDRIQKPIVGIMLYDRLRTAITGFNTYQYQHHLYSLLPEQLLTVEFSLEWPEIQGGNYVLEPAIADGSQENHEMLDWLQFPLNIISGATDLTFGVFRLSSVNISHQITVSQSPTENYLETTRAETRKV
ncbi:phosphate/phosphonate ABC transporter ATP-binding protein [Hydrococcus rivularis NIES-593]|uniref:Phosphate/phosphonate ABC transporter ATP-binding protein n=1 Tax=Hydrococcus rivularis NIES-593 TaxID=1921803 RepID=A0A1U7HT64_9CYAN|nr:ABC transporter ATP-binding protein [Hydrococcus rivularis]OKH26783.1 phosphate/phosphonate ABC transporter ATP-binding protein [Hydrococcus rivularis NIES-593]